MKKLILAIILFSSFHVLAQTLDPEGIFSSSGNHNVSDYAQMSWTLGDNQTRMYKNTDLVLTQGFLQSRIIVTGIPELLDINRMNFKLYPNPVSDILYIQKEKNVPENTSIELFSMDGKLILQKNFKVESDIEEINFAGLENGIYLLEIFSRKNKFKYTYKVVLQN
jgi:hypothetical protein